MNGTPEYWLQLIKIVTVMLDLPLWCIQMVFSNENVLGPL